MGIDANPESPRPEAMKIKFARALYLLTWILIAGAVTYFLIDAGLPWWLALFLAFQLFFFLNGTLTYFVRVRRSREDGEKPPTYFSYLFFAGRNPYSDDVPMPSVLRGAIGTVFLLAGVALTLLGLALPTLHDLSQLEGLVKGLVTLAIFWALGLPITYVGYRLLIMEKGEAMLKITDNKMRKKT